MKLPIGSVRVDPALQLRDGLDMDRVKAMTEFEELGGHLPPITVVGADNLLGDGHHRLEVAHRAGKLEIEAERVPGGMAEAVAAAIQLNDLATTLPLTRTQRNKGVKLLLQAGWTQERIATVTGVHRTTIVNIGNALAMRGELAKSTKPSRGAAGGPTPKPVAVLPKEIHEKLGDTVLVRIAETVPLDQQAEFAAAVAQVNLPEPRVREAIKDLRAGGVTPTEAVAGRTPQTREMPRTLPEVTRQVRHRLERFLEEPMTVEGTERDFWAVLDVLAANADRIPLEANGLAVLLADIAVRADAYSTRLLMERIEATA